MILFRLQVLLQLIPYYKEGFGGEFYIPNSVPLSSCLTLLIKK
jgi:hypothetical protein